MRLSFNEIKATMKVLESMPMEHPVDIVFFYNNIVSSLGIKKDLILECSSEVTKEITQTKGIEITAKNVEDKTISYALTGGERGVIQVCTSLDGCSDDDLMVEIVATITPCCEFYGAMLDKISSKTGIEEIEV